jgi:hypothetical protein
MRDLFGQLLGFRVCSWESFCILSLRPLTLVEGFEFVLFTAIGLLPTYALDQGFGRETSFNVIAIMNA